MMPHPFDSNETATKALPLARLRHGLALLICPELRPSVLQASSGFRGETEARGHSEARRRWIEAERSRQGEEGELAADKATCVHSEARRRWIEAERSRSVEEAAREDRSHKPVAK